MQTTKVKDSGMTFIDEWREFQLDAFNTAKDHGFHDGDSDEPNILNLQFEQRLMLIVGEVAEAHDDHRHGCGIQDMSLDEMTGKPGGIPSELADIVIRVADLAETYGIDLALAIGYKMMYNKDREFMHGRQF